MGDLPSQGLWRNASPKVCIRTLIDACGLCVRDPFACTSEMYLGTVRM